MHLTGRISVDPRRREGKAGVRDTGFTVAVVLRMLAADGSAERILQRMPDLETGDIVACLHYAAEQVDHPVPVAVPLRLKIALVVLLTTCVMQLWLIGSPGAPWWAVGLASLGTVVSIWSLVFTRYPIHVRRSARI